MNQKRVVVIDAVGLSPRHFESKEKVPYLNSLITNGHLHRMNPVFPALTLPAQASLTTGVYPDAHGVVSNGFYFPENYQIAFWEQASSLVQSERIWDRLKKRDPGHKTAVLFFQNSLYASCDVVITPKPIHTEESLILWCYSKPIGLYEKITEKQGEFPLFSYWGPLASIDGSRWIAQSSLEVMSREKPDLMYVYLPHLDYSSQKYDPSDARIDEDLKCLDDEVKRIVEGIKDMGLSEETVFVILSEYILSGVQGDIPINRLLREKGLLRVREIKGREYLDCELSPAFAMVDHQIAHIYIKPGSEKAVRTVLEGVNGIDLILDRKGKKKYRVDNARSGDILAVSARNKWFSYYWWEDRAKEPDFATHIDIHRKPGYDPLELFFDPGTFNISQDTSLIHGSHGYPPLTGDDQVVFLVCGERADDFKVPENLCITDVSKCIEDYLSSK